MQANDEDDSKRMVKDLKILDFALQKYFENWGILVNLVLDKYDGKKK